MAKLSLNSALRCTASGMIYLAFAQNAMAQDTDFLGTIQLGESKREVQTDTATAVTVVDQEEIDDRQAGTIAQLIDSVPGVALVNGSTPSGSGINIRGYGANSIYGTDQKVAIQVDGASTGAEEIYRIGNQLFTDPTLFKSVEVIRGTVGSFAYGSGIVGGVVRLETKDASDFTGGEPGFVINQRLGFSSNGDGVTASALFAWQPTEDFEFLASYTQRNQDSQTDGDGAVIGNSAFELPTWLVKAKYTLGQNKDQSITFSFSDTSTAERDVPYDTFITTADAFGAVDRDTKSRTATLQYAYNPASSDLIDLTVTLSYADQQIDQSYVPGTSSCENFACGFPFPPTGFGTSNADHRYETTKLNVTNESFVTTSFGDHEITSGFELIRKERLDASAAPGGTDNRWAVFLVDEIQFGQSLTVTPALRYESSSIEGSTAPNDGSFDNEALMGGVSARYEFDSGLAVFGSAAYTESLPILDDLGNAAFMEQAEKSTTFEIGTSYNSFDVLRSGDELSLKANLYQTTTKDITSYSSNAFAQDANGDPIIVMGRNGPSAQRTTIDKIETSGLELEASYAMESGFYIDASANIAEGTEVTPFNDVDWRNTPANSLGVTFGKKFGDELDLSWEIVANAQRSYTIEEFDDTTLQVSDVTTKVDSFAVHNLRATYIPQSGFLADTEIRASIENLFDESYQPALSTRPAPGRNFIFSISKSF